MGAGDRRRVETRFFIPRRRVARQDAGSTGRVRFGDFDSDGLPDLVLYDPTRDAAPVWIARNRGLLPDTRPSLAPANLAE